MDVIGSDSTKEDLFNGELSGSDFAPIRVHTQATGTYTQPYFDPGRTNSHYMDADYSSGVSGSRFPINYDQIKNNSAIKATVPDSNYTITGIINSKYKGTKVTSPRINNTI